MYVNTFVDGGQYSPAGDLGTGIWYSYPNGNINYLWDAPTAPLGIKKVTFETIVVANDYHGKMYALGSFKWGFDNFGAIRTGAAASGISTLGPVSQTAKDIIKRDYPNVKINY